MGRRNKRARAGRPQRRCATCRQRANDTDLTNGQCAKCIRDGKRKPAR